MTTPTDKLLQFDRDHLWHPYSSMSDPLEVYPVQSARGARLTLENGRQLIDGMSSWWSAIHGYNVEEINTALQQQMGEVSHVMFGGLTHQPAVELGRRLIDLTPEPLQKLFLADSGSIAVEVALKMAIQYWISQERPNKRGISALRGGYHGDTFATMALADPDNGMHTLFQDLLSETHFVPRPDCRYGEVWDPEAAAPLQQLLEQEHESIAALILEPVVQGAGGMWFYHPQFLKEARALCDRYEVLLIADEIATGFGRTGELFGCDHAGIVPDILSLGKALTGGTMTLAATITTSHIADSISSYGEGTLMHGPTFMANPLACRAANASIDLLRSSPWRERVQSIESRLIDGLASCRGAPGVRDVRAVGAIGVVEMEQPVDMKRVQPQFVELGVWVRPFGPLIYLMPPYIITPEELEQLTAAVVRVVDSIGQDAAASTAEQ